MTVLMPLLLAATIGAGSTPFTPVSDERVLAHLPAGGFLFREKLAAPGSLTDPERLVLIDQLINAGKSQDQPRLLGQAEALLRPRLHESASQWQLLHAEILQWSHDFKAAEKVLSKVIASEPDNSRALLMRAGIRQIRGHYRQALQDCVRIPAWVPPLVRATCSLQARSFTGRLDTSYKALAKVYAELHDQSAQSLWSLGVLAEMAERLGRDREAETWYRQALLIDPESTLTLATYGEFLLRQNKYPLALRLLEGARSESLKLLYAIAARALDTEDSEKTLVELNDMLAAIRLRREDNHAGLLARYALDIRGDAVSAVRLAREHWSHQKAPADTLLLVRAALASGDRVTLAQVQDWLAANNVRDDRIRALLAAKP